MLSAAVVSEPGECVTLANKEWYCDLLTVMKTPGWPVAQTEIIS